MSYISTAIGTERLSRTSGYNIKKGNFQNTTDNLPQIIAILGEANTAAQSSINTDKREITSSEEAGRIYGYGSPIHQIMRILRPVDSDGVGGIPTIVFPQLEAVGSTATVQNWSVTGTATKSTTHLIRVAGRENLDYQTYSFNIVKGETASQIAAKIRDAINNVLSSPIAATGATTELILTTKWKGLTSSFLQVEFNNNGDGAGITYAMTTNTAGTGTPAIIDSLNQFGSDWYTCVINPYGEEHFETLEQFNGTPSTETPTGRYAATTFKPFMAFFGSVETDITVLSDITNDAARVNQVTNVLCPAPASKAFPWEAATNVVRLFARTMQDTPESDINGKPFPDMPIPLDANIGDMSFYNNRDFLIKKGCSTVILNKGVYEIQDLVTTYHPEGERPLQFNYCRNLNLDWNVKDAYSVLEIIKLRDKVLIMDNQVTSSTMAIKPKEWKAILFDLFEDLGERALINDPAFSKESLRVGINETNPNRFDTFFRYKRTGIARIESTTAEAGF
jgi:phage tail sheath gpL-like